MNGPGKFYYGSDVFQHLFDGSALIQKYAIAKDGQVYYQCKFLRSKSFIQVETLNFNLGPFHFANSNVFISPITIISRGLVRKGATGAWHP